MTSVSDEADFWVLAALALVARGKVDRYARGPQWTVRQGQPWCPEMARTLDALLYRGLIRLHRNQFAEITPTGGTILLALLDPRLHPAVS